MKHTAAIAGSVLSLVVAEPLVAQGGGTPPKPQPSAVQQLADRVAELEKRLRGVSLQIETADQFPNGVDFKVKTRLRVLAGTHFHLVAEATFGAQDRSLKETVVTPEGCWRHQRDPIEDIYLRMKPELVTELREKTRALNRDAENRRLGLPGTEAADGGIQLGSSLLRALHETFSLVVLDKKKTVDGIEYLVLTGENKDTGEFEGSTPPPRIAKRVEVLCRQSDGVPMQMTQFNAQGQPLLRYSVTDLKLDPLLEPKSFRLDKPEGRTFVDIEDHPPSWAQVIRIREQFEAQKAERNGPAASTESRPDRAR